MTIAASHPIACRNELPRARRVVVKIGSAVLAPDGELDPRAVARLADEISSEAHAGVEIVVVSSGAVASGFRLLGLTGKPRTIVEKQAAAAVGQQRLMSAYAEAFTARKRTIAQVLLTADDMDHRPRLLNARRTLQELLSHGVVPIINENDSVSYDEIKLGDNDHLSALVASLVQADALIILSTVNGVLASGSGAVIHEFQKPDDASIHITSDKSATGVGGMTTKVNAARTAGAAGIPTVIAGGTTHGNIRRVLAGEIVGSFFVPRARAAAARKRWIGSAARPRGTLVVDEGARRAIIERGASLLPSGLTTVEGEFPVGSPVEIRTAGAPPFARGIASYASSEAVRLIGRKAAQIESILGYTYADEIVHRSNMSLVDPA